jgi:hypothetical protein
MPFLQTKPLTQNGRLSGAATWKEYLANQFNEFGYRFVPLVVQDLPLRCNIHVMMLRYGKPGDILFKGDLDNRIKTLVDALRKPQQANELGNFPVPGKDEDPFYVLLQDDKLITSLSVETDTLLEPVNGKIDPLDCRLYITVKLHPLRATMETLNFA